MAQRQLEFFSRSELASMRDRTKARNYSPEAEQFRRDHKRHRDWGLTQRHGFKMMELRRQGEPFALAAAKAGGWQALTAAEVMQVAAESLSWRRAKAGAPPPDQTSEPSDSPTPEATCSPDQVARPEPTGQIPFVESAARVTLAKAEEQVQPIKQAGMDDQVKLISHPEPAGHACPAGQTEPAQQVKPAKLAGRLDRAQPAEQIERIELAARDDQVESVGHTNRRHRRNRRSRPERPVQADPRSGRAKPDEHGGPDVLSNREHPCRPEE